MIQFLDDIPNAQGNEIEVSQERSDVLLPMQCKMARVAAGWGMRDLARIANVSMDTVIRLERGERVKEATIERLRITWNAIGIEFDDGDAPGVRLRPAAEAVEQQGDPDLINSVLPAQAPRRQDGKLPVRLPRLRASYGEKIGRRLSQPKFAALLGISTAQYDTYERGDCEPGLAVLVALRRLTGVSLDELIDG